MKVGTYLAAACVAALLALTGCGGESGGATAETATSLSKAEFMKQAKAICAKGTDRIDVLYTRASRNAPKSDPGERFMNEAAARIVLPVRREELRKLRALGLPREDGQWVEEFLEALEEGIERGEASHPSLRAVEEPYAFERAYALAGISALGSCFRG